MTDMMTRLTAETALLRTRLESFTRQAASGQRAERLGELAPQLPRAVSLRAELGRRDVYSRAMEQAEGRIAVSQGALGRMRDIAREFRTEVAMRLNSRDTDSLATVQARARAALTEVGQLLNTRHAGEYVFAGADITRPPVPDPAGLGAGPLATAIATEVATLAPGNGAAVAAQTIAFASTDTSPFSAHVAGFPPGAPEMRRAVPSGDGEAIAYGLHADRNTDAASAGETTGGWARDLLRNLMVLAAMTPAQMQAAPEEFDTLAGSVREGFRAAEEALAEEGGALGLAERRIEAAQTRHEAVSTTLRRQLSGIEEVDLAETLTRLQATRTTLEASYRAIGMLSGLNLAQFLR